MSARTDERGKQFFQPLPYLLPSPRLMMEEEQQPGIRSRWQKGRGIFFLLPPAYLQKQGQEGVEGARVKCLKFRQQCLGQLCNLIKALPLQKSGEEERKGNSYSLSSHSLVNHPHTLSSVLWIFSLDCTPLILRFLHKSIVGKTSFPLCVSSHAAQQESLPP